MSSITTSQSMPFTNNFINNFENTRDPLPPPVIVQLKEGESFHAEPGSMLAYKNLTVLTKKSVSGVLATLKNYVLGGESFFVNIYTGNKGGGWLALEENHPGQIAKIDLEPGKGFIVRRGAYLASTPNVKLTTIYKGFTGVMQGKGLATTSAIVEGNTPGALYFHAPSGVVRKFHISESDGPIMIDNNMILGHTENLQLTSKKMGNYKSLAFSGEGWACEFSGEGDVFVEGGSLSGNALSSVTDGAAQGGQGLLIQGAVVVGLIGVSLVVYKATGVNILEYMNG